MTHDYNSHSLSASGVRAPQKDPHSPRQIQVLLGEVDSYYNIVELKTRL